MSRARHTSLRLLAGAIPYRSPSHPARLRRLRVTSETGPLGGRASRARTAFDATPSPTRAGRPEVYGSGNKNPNRGTKRRRGEAGVGLRFEGITARKRRNSRQGLAFFNL